ncbi:13190_t:CDS:2 [Funneliformis geosporum]|uniref:13190_t:CDS:1 n=1 Tax=Funneliformis geosporum TaxID=1117311 RepID=A0A9W4T2C4_9GLOM|nr:13190_t:CDS:2 [Funneliformis geosporum]
MECLYQYTIKHGLDPEKFSIVTEAEKKKGTVNKRKRDNPLMIDPRKYYPFLTDRDRLIGEELMRHKIFAQA